MLDKIYSIKDQLTKEQFNNLISKSSEILKLKDMTANELLTYAKSNNEEANNEDINWEEVFSKL